MRVQPTTLLKGSADDPTKPRGSRYLIIKDVGLKDHDYCGFCGLSP